MSASVSSLDCGPRVCGTFTEVQMARKVTLRTKDAESDLDKIVDYLDQMINNDGNRYLRLHTRVARLRKDTSGDCTHIGSPLRPESQKSNWLAEAFHGTENRSAGDAVDDARALFSILDMKWDNHWNMLEGFDHIAEAFPSVKDILGEYCQYRKIDWPIT
ncbi:hypothetical protein EV356DRAFT_38697 [Viridothelium virens]|uniref:Uncharacterized protein n=1 Tax=Viridothelium virens TaxID=1048519 RepID=A0A6A6HFU6_VIRVR|nr:hypothetical protein EV356DRAFT_38697 [Viridothelium virens]